MKKVTAKAKAFSNQGVKEHEFMVEDDGSVLVYDPVAKHFTRCHCLGKSAIGRIRKLAEKN